MDGQTGMKKLIVAYRDFAYARESVKLGTPVMTRGTLQFLWQSVIWFNSSKEGHTRTHTNTHTVR